GAGRLQRVANGLRDLPHRVGRTAILAVIRERVAHDVVVQPPLRVEENEADALTVHHDGPGTTTRRQHHDRRAGVFRSPRNQPGLTPDDEQAVGGGRRTEEAALPAVGPIVIPGQEDSRAATGHGPDLRVQATEYVSVVHGRGVSRAGRVDV